MSWKVTERVLSRFGTRFSGQCLYRAVLVSAPLLYLRAKNAKVCPFLVDSRCRVLKANRRGMEPGTLVGTAISPGVVTGTVRVITSPNERLKKGEILEGFFPSWAGLRVEGAS